MAQGLRLSTLKSWALHPVHVWDIGCDHGLLGLSFLDHPQTQSLTLVDPSEEVINVLKEKVKAADITKGLSLQLLCQKGQELKLPSQISKTLFIAGMGGGEIQSILYALSGQLGENDEVIISPHRKILELRAFLGNSFWKLRQETVIFEKGQFYQILALGKQMTMRPVPPFGDELWKGEWGPSYREQQLKAFSAHQDPLSRKYVTFLQGLSL